MAAAAHTLGSSYEPCWPAICSKRKLLCCVATSTFYLLLSIFNICSPQYHEQHATDLNRHSHEPIYVRTGNVVLL